MHAPILLGFNRDCSLPLVAWNHAAGSFDFTPTLTLLASNRHTRILPRYWCYLCTPCCPAQIKKLAAGSSLRPATSTTPGTPKLRTAHMLVLCLGGAKSPDNSQLGGAKIDVSWGNGFKAPKKPSVTTRTGGCDPLIRLIKQEVKYMPWKSKAILQLAPIQMKFCFHL